MGERPPNRNRASRRFPLQGITLSTLSPRKIPVYRLHSPGVWEWAEGKRIDELIRARNAEPQHRRGQLVSFLIHDYGSDFNHAPRHGNPQKDVTQAETDENPPKVWAFKHHREA
jgi:hypothetical protein